MNDQVCQICENPSIQSPLNRASKDKFVLLLNLPHFLRKQAQEDLSLDLRTLQLSIFGSVVPSISVPETNVRFGGQGLNVSSYSRPSYGPLDVSFIVDSNYQNYYLLWRWLDVMNTANDSVYGGSYGRPLTDQHEIGDNLEYQSDISILALNEYSQTEIEFLYTKAFVTNLGSINYNYKDSGLLECTAQFQFSQLLIKKTISEIIPSSE